MATEESPRIRSKRVQETPERLKRNLGYWTRFYRQRLPGAPSQERFARQVDLSHNYISQIERALHMPRPEALIKIAQGLGVYVSDLLLDPKMTPPDGFPARPDSQGLLLMEALAA